MVLNIKIISSLKYTIASIYWLIHTWLIFKKPKITDNIRYTYYMIKLYSTHKNSKM